MSKALFSQFATDRNVEKDGIFITYDDVRIRIARAGGANRQFNRVFQQEIKPVEQRMKRDKLSDAESDKLTATIYAKAVILGWETNFGSEDKPEWRPTFTIPASRKAGRPEDEVLEFTPDNVVRVLLMLPEMFADIRDQATTASNFRVDEDEADAKN